MISGGPASSFPASGCGVKQIIRSFAAAICAPGAGGLERRPPKKCRSTNGINSVLRLAALLELFELGADLLDLAFEARDVGGVIHLLARAGKLLPQLLQPQIQQIDPLFGLLIHSSRRESV